MTKKRAWCVVMLVIFASACSGGNSATTSPSPLPLPAATTAPTVPGLGMISGVVSEMTPSGRLPIEGVYVTGAWDYPVNTDDKGSFTLSDCGDSPCRFQNGERVTLYLSKDGYQQNTTEVTVNGDTRLDIQLVRR